MARGQCFIAPQPVILPRRKTHIAVYLLKEMGHKQPTAPIQTDNTMAGGVINKKVQLKQTKAMDTQFHWLQNRNARINFDSIGDQVRWITPTIGPNITQ